ncbi:hypothetical protein [Ignatzschineria sp. LJL83]
MFSKLRTIALVSSISFAFIPTTLFASQASRVADANYEFCTQEFFANDDYCSCVADVYETNLENVQFTDEEETFIIQGLSGQLSFEELTPEDLILSDRVAEKLINPAFEEGFVACYSYIDDSENEENFDESEVVLSEAQLRAIAELDEIEAMEDEEYEE